MYYSFYIWVGDRMDLKQLQYFATVAKEGNISKAAKALHISQPPLSIQLKHLEEELGCVLFERGAREVELTRPGCFYTTARSPCLNSPRSPCRRSPI